MPNNGVTTQTIYFDHKVVVSELSPSTPLSYNRDQVLWIRSAPGEPDKHGRLAVRAQCRAKGQDVTLILYVEAQLSPGSKDVEHVAKHYATMARNPQEHDTTHAAVA